MTALTCIKAFDPILQQQAIMTDTTPDFKKPPKLFEGVFYQFGVKWILSDVQGPAILCSITSVRGAQCWPRGHRSAEWPFQVSGEELLALKGSNRSEQTDGDVDQLLMESSWQPVMMFQSESPNLESVFLTFYIKFDYI